MAAFNASSALSLTIGVVEVALGLAVIRQLGRFGTAFPWLAALMAFFLLRGSDRIYVALAGGDPLSIRFLLDAIVLLVLVLLLLGVQRLARALRLFEDAARYRQQEYGRALLDYRRLVRHRLANPIAAIKGAIETLEARPALDEETRLQLLRVAREQAQRLERAALEPEQLTAEESDLDPRPRAAQPPALAALDLDLTDSADGGGERTRP